MPRESRGLRVRRASRRCATAIAAALALISVPVALGGTFGGFKGPKTFQVGNDPVAVVAGDFNRDGNQDLASANFNAGDVTILRARGGGGFKRVHDYQVGGNPIAIATGHFNGDRDLDLAVATNGAVSVLLGGDGATFDAAKFYGSYGGFQARGIAVADLDRDGRRDIVVTNDFPHTDHGQVSILLGDGQGAFGSQQDFALNQFPGEVAIANLNGGHRKDLVILGGGAAFADQNNVMVLLGKQGSLFGAPKTFDGGPIPFGLALGDLDGDGKTDVAVSDFGQTSDGRNVVSVLFGKRHGLLGGPHEFEVGEPGDQPQDVAAVDLNGDHRRDLAVANSDATGPGEVAVLINRGDRKFKRRRYFDAGDSPQFVAAGQLGGDRSKDVVTANGSSNHVAVLINKG